MNDYVPIQRHPFIGHNWYRLCDISFGKRATPEHFTFQIASIIIFGYGFQLMRRP